MKIILADTNRAVTDAYREHCADLPEVEIYEGSILDIDCEAIVSPANSFGFMDGGLDKEIIAKYGAQLQQAVLNLIRSHWHQELLVGSAIRIELPPESAPGILVVAPTMRVPMILPRDTINPFLATRAAINEVRYDFMTSRGKRGPVESLAIPGMGTGIGRVSPSLCARQVRAAIECARVHWKDWQPPQSATEAMRSHQRLYGGSASNLQVPAGNV